MAELAIVVKSVEEAKLRYKAALKLFEGVEGASVSLLVRGRWRETGWPRADDWELHSWYHKVKFVKGFLYLLDEKSNKWLRAEPNIEGSIQSSYLYPAIAVHLELKKS